MITQELINAPTADSAANTTVSDVLGNKSDTVAGNSVVAISKQIKAETDQIGTVVNTGGTATLAGVVGDVSNTSIASRLTTIESKIDTVDDFIDTEIGTPTNTGGTASIAAILGDPNNVSMATNLAKIGTITNTGGTATIGGVLGDVNNVSVATYLLQIDTDTSQIEDVTLSDAPTAGSISRFLATGGVSLGAQLPASKSLYDMVRQYGDGYVTTKTITYDGSASYAAFTVAGSVFARVIGTIDTALSNVAATTSVGTTTSAAGLIAATAGTAMQTVGNAWTDNAPSNFESPIDLQATALIGGSEAIVVDGDVTLVAGVVTLYCFWKPLGSGSLIAA